MGGEVTILRPAIERADRVHDRPHATAGHGRRELVDDRLHVTAANVRHAFGFESGLRVNTQALVDVVDRA